jgi:aromatic-L-amino-acid decarboxylase
MLWLTSPACTEVETKVLDWVADLLDLPAAFRSTTDGGGVIQDTASSATLCALLAARERATGFVTNRAGIDRTLRVYASREAHSSIPKSVKIAGIGEENLRLIDVDENHALDPRKLETAIAEDLRAGHAPCFVCATVGTTSSNGIDPVPAIGAIAKRHGLWLHVDAAAAGSAAVCPEYRFIHAGLELADSYCFNPHKWLLTNFDCDCFYVTDREALVRTLSVTPEYLRNRATETGAVFDYRDWHVPLGRRFRALKLWFVIRHYGAEGLRRFVRQHVEMARELAERVRAEPRLELDAGGPLNLFCFRHAGGDAPTEALHERLNATGRIYLSHTRLDGRFLIRFCVGSTHTSWRHIDEAWSLIVETLNEMDATAGMLSA